MAEWVVLELTSQGEDEDPEVLRSAVLRMLRGAEIFVPASISIQGDNRVVHKLIDNYVFVRKDQPDAFYYKTEGTKYVTSVLTTPSGRTRRLSTVKDDAIEKMRRQIQVETEQGIEVGDDVEVMSGPYKGIYGKVIEEIPENDSVQVHISLRSKQAIVTLPRSFLRFAVDQESDMPTFSPFLTKSTRIADFVKRAQTAKSPELASGQQIYGANERLKKLRPWYLGTERLVPDVMGRRAVQLYVPSPVDLDFGLAKIQGLLSSLRLFTMALQVAREIEFAAKVPDVPDASPLESKVQSFLGFGPMAVKHDGLVSQVRVGTEIKKGERLPSSDSISELIGRLSFLEQAIARFKTIKTQTSKTEAVVKKAENENARKRRR